MDTLELGVASLTLVILVRKTLASAPSRPASGGRITKKDRYRPRGAVLCFSDVASLRFEAREAHTHNAAT